MESVVLKPGITVPSGFRRSDVFPPIFPPMRYVPFPPKGVQDMQYLEPIKRTSSAAHDPVSGFQVSQVELLP